MPRVAIFPCRTSPFWTWRQEHHIADMLVDVNMVALPAVALMANLEQGTCTDAGMPPVCWQLLAITWQSDIFVLRATTGRCTVTAVFLVQSAFMPAQIPQSLPNHCSNQGHSLDSAMALVPTTSEIKGPRGVPPHTSRQANHHILHYA